MQRCVVPSICLFPDEKQGERKGVEKEEKRKKKKEKRKKKERKEQTREQRETIDCIHTVLL